MSGARHRSTMLRMYHEAFGQMKKQLGQLDKWLDAAVAHAKTKSFDPNLFVGFRLAPDQFAFVRQVQIACDTAKLGASRLTGKDAPARVATVIGDLDGLTAKDFEGAATRVVSMPRWEGKVMTGADYFLEHAQPNFFFHIAHTYAILRHNGVPIGKRDYLGAISLRAP